MYRIFNIFRTRHLINVFTILALLIFWKCSDFLEDDLEDSEVFLLAPADSAITALSNHTFLWEPVKDASGYNLQIVSPSFTSIQQIVLDTNISGNQFQVTLSPGEYQWGVVAYNSSSSTLQYYFTLTIDTSGLLTGEQVVLLSPPNNQNTNETNIRFKWEKNPKATSYYFELKKVTGEHVSSEVLYTDSVLLDISEGAYIWGIQALNDISSSLLTKHTLVVDTMAPLVPRLLLPGDTDTITQMPFTLSWERQGTSTAMVTDSVLIATDSLFTSVVNFIETGSTSFTVLDEDNGIYFWKVKSVDKAGNNSDYSHFRQYTIDK